MSATGLGKKHRKQAAVYASVSEIADPVVEAKRRWPDLAWRDSVQPARDGLLAYRFVEGRWSVDGRAHGLRNPVRMSATWTEIIEAKAQIARHALYNDELRKAGIS